MLKRKCLLAHSMPSTLLLGILLYYPLHKQMLCKRIQGVNKFSSVLLLLCLVLKWREKNLENAVMS